MYWRIGFAAASPVDAILDRKDFTLEQLLDEDELIQECKSMNKKLIGYLTQPKVVEELLILISQEPDPNVSVERRFKYPFIACEILCCEIPGVFDIIFEHEDIENQLFSFIDAPPPLNPLLAGYFCRVVSSLLNRKTSEAYSTAQKKNEFLLRFVEHIGTYSVMNLLLKIIHPDDPSMMLLSPTEKDHVQRWLVDSGVVPLLAAKFDATQDSEMHANAAEALVGIVNRQCSPTSGFTGMVQQLQSPDVLQKLFNQILNGSTSTLVHGLSVILELLERNRYGTTLQGQPVEQGQDDEPPSPLIPVVVERLGSFASLLRQVPTPDPIATTFGELSPPLGSARLKVVEFFVGLISVRYPDVYDAIMKAEVVDSCLDLFFQYKWNNFLHAQVERLVNAILESGNEAFVTALFQKCRLVERILEGVTANKTACSLPKGSRLGYMGYITRMSNAIVKLGVTEPYVKSLLDDVAGWKTYVDGVLAGTNQAEARALGGTIPAAAVQEESEDDELFGRAELDMEVLSNISDFKPNGPDQRFERYFFDSNDMSDDFDHLPEDSETTDFPFDPEVEADFDTPGTFAGEEQTPMWLEKEIVDKSRPSASVEAAAMAAQLDLEVAASSSTTAATTSSTAAELPMQAQPQALNFCSMIGDEDSDDVVVQSADDDEVIVPENQEEQAPPSAPSSDTHVPSSASEWVADFAAASTEAPATPTAADAAFVSSGTLAATYDSMAAFDANFEAAFSSITTAISQSTTALSLPPSAVSATGSTDVDFSFAPTAPDAINTASNIPIALGAMSATTPAPTISSTSVPALPPASPVSSPIPSSSVQASQEFDPFSLGAPAPATDLDLTPTLAPTVAAPVPVAASSEWVADFGTFERISSVESTASPQHMTAAFLSASAGPEVGHQPEEPPPDSPLVPTVAMDEESTAAPAAVATGSGSGYAPESGSEAGSWGVDDDAHAMDTQPTVARAAIASSAAVGESSMEEVTQYGEERTDVPRAEGPLLSDTAPLGGSSSGGEDGSGTWSSTAGASATSRGEADAPLDSCVVSMAKADSEEPNFGYWRIANHLETARE